MPYIYALATHPAFRGRGLAGKLLKYAEKVAKEWGAAGVCTLPADPSLYGFYGKMGYNRGLYGGLYPPVLDAVKGVLDAVEGPVFPTKKEKNGIFGEDLPGREERSGDHGETPHGAGEEKTGKPAGRVVVLGPGEYNALRRKLLEGRAYLDLPDELIAFQKAISRLSGGDLYGILPPGGGEGPAAGSFGAEGACAPRRSGDGAAAGAVAGVAAVEMEGGRALVKEGLPLAGEGAPFGMLKWFAPGPPPGPVYLGLAFD